MAAVQGKRRCEEVTADAGPLELRTGYPHGRDDAVGRQMKAPRAVYPVFQLQVEEFGPFLVGLVGHRAAVTGQKKGEVARGFRFPLHDQVVDVQYRP